MKKLSFLFICLLVIASCSTDQKTNTEITGKIKGLAEGTSVYLTAMNSEGANDSVVAGKESFRFDLNLTEGDTYYFQIGKTRDQNGFLMCYIEPGKVLIEGKDTLFKDARLSGGKSISDWNDMQNAITSAPGLERMEELSEEINEAYVAQDTAKVSALMPGLTRMDSIRTEVLKKWMTDHYNSPIAAVVLSWLEYNYTPGEKEAHFNNLTPEARQNAVAKKIENSIRVEKLTAVGQVAPEFTQNDTLGNPVSLKDFRGKYVLIDFWASWCGPCRAENPNVVKAFNQFKDKNFTVLGVSLDRPDGKANWINAIHEDGLTWTHVSDLKFWDNEVAVQYNIRSIPSNLLIGPDGVILAKDIRGEELELKLGALLGSR